MIEIINRNILGAAVVNLDFYQFATDPTALFLNFKNSFYFQLENLFILQQDSQVSSYFSLLFNVCAVVGIYNL